MQRSLTTNENGAPDIDAILQIEQELKKLKQNGYTIIIYHIKAHQDIPDDPDDSMRCAIEFNKEADWLAGTAHIRQIIPHDNTTKYPAGTVHVYCKTEQIHEGVHWRIDLAGGLIHLTQFGGRFTERHCRGSNPSVG